MKKLKFSCTVENTSRFDNLKLEFWLDNIKFFDSAVASGKTSVCYDFEEDNASHCLKIVLKDKTHEHTTVDDSGNIVSDVLISIKEICFDDIPVDQMIFDNATYTHNNNNSTDDIEDKFYGHLGCNGTVALEIKTPLYLWLLENM